MNWASEKYEPTELQVIKKKTLWALLVHTDQNKRTLNQISSFGVSTQDANSQEERKKIVGYQEKDLGVEKKSIFTDSLDLQSPMPFKLDH